MSSALLFLVTLLSTRAISSVSGETQHCVDVPTDEQYKAEDIEGVWYPVEIILHRNDSKIYGVPLETNCPVVNFTVRAKKSMYMYWNSSEGDLEYKFTPKGRGQWQAIYDQKGSLVNDEYKHYGGIFRVLKMEGDFMFLGYCSKKFHVLNSVVYSKTGKMPPEDIKETFKELESMKIKREIVVKPCTDDSSSHRILTSCFLSILPSLVVRFPL